METGLANVKKAGIERLGERRAKAFDSFSQNAANSVTFRHWFPRKVDRIGGQQCEVYKEYFARNDKLKYLPRFVMRQRLNGKINDSIKPRLQN